MAWKVLITARVFDVVGREALDYLRQNDCEVIIPPRFGPLRGAELVEQVAGADATLCSPDQYTSEVLQSAAVQQLKIISRWGVGFDSIDVAAATRTGIVVAYTPGMLTETVADWTWALMLGIARRVHEGHSIVAQGRWAFPWGHDVSGKTLGIVGCGRIGQAVAKRAAGFDMRVLGFDVHQPPGFPYEMVSLERLLRESDFVSLHAALTPENRGLINTKNLRLMKPTAYLINTARGPLVDEAGLAQALQEGWIAGAALDVFSTEPLPADNPLRQAPNLLITPHLASFARETGERVSMAAAQAIVALKEGFAPRWLVNPEVMRSPALRARLNSKVE